MSEQQPPPTTTDAGIPVESDEHSLTVGPDGPVLLHDHYLIEQMANFKRERITGLTDWYQENFASLGDSV